MLRASQWRSLFLDQVLIKLDLEMGYGAVRDRTLQDNN